MITHDYNMVKQFPSRTITFENGKVTEQAEVKEIDFESLKE
jgi:ABC-type methionine transport system ATPase subunit